MPTADRSSFFRTNCENLCSMRDLYEVEHADATGDATDRFYAQNLIEVKLSELESRIAPLYDRFLERQKEDQCEDEGILMGKPPFASWQQISSSGTLSVCASTRNGHARLPKSCSETFI